MFNIEIFNSIILAENEKRISARIEQRIYEIENLPATLPEDLRIRAEIELRSVAFLSLRKINFTEMIEIE